MPSPSRRRHEPSFLKDGEARSGQPRPSGLSRVRLEQGNLPVIAAHVAQHADHAAAEFMVFGWMLDSDVLEEGEAAQ